jgi:hypothetical protein
MSRIVVLLLVFLPSALCAFWPLSWEFDGEKRFMGPLASYREADGEKQLTLRPLLFSYDTKDGGICHFLYPLGKSTKDKSFLVPFYMSKGMDDQRDTSILLFFFGKSKEKSYGGLFPLYGKMYDRFGKDKLGFFAWPLYSHTEADGAGRTNILWPFFSVYSGTEQGFKAWPLYGTRKKEGVRETTFFLWPIFTREKKDLDTDDPVSSFYAFPIYIRSTSRTKASYHILYPLFSYQRSEDRTRYGFLFSLASRTKGAEGKGFSLLPIASRYESGKDRTTNFLWPLFKDSEWYVKDEKYVEKRMMLLSRYLEDDRGTYLGVWPLFEHEKKGDRSSFVFPAILPIRYEEYHRIVRPLITLYERKQDGQKQVVNVLYGFYTKEEEGEMWRRRLAFLFEAKNDRKGFGFEFLSGLFAMDSDKVRIFFIPVKRSAGE